MNLFRCLSSVAWAAQVLMVECGSTDRTVAIARDAGATVVETHWRGFGSQREFAMRLPEIVHDWTYIDLKDLAAWLRKHVSYAELEAERRSHRAGNRTRLPHESRLRFWVKDRIAPRVPARPLVTFIYMYVVRAGFLDGRQGLLFCFLHAWFQTVGKQLEHDSAHREVALPVSQTGAQE